ncbi:MAG: hypothetical protein OHK0023_14980 [Anaerolineae bacterium]
MTDADKPRLVSNRGKYKGQKWTMLKTPFVVGRDPTCDMIVNEGQVSREHIRINGEGDYFTIEDLESRNGTWLNGVPLKGMHRLKDGDEIDLAHQIHLIFLVSGATEPLMEDTSEMQPGKIFLDRQARRVFIGDKEILPPLSLPQYRLLEKLFDADGAICTRDEVVLAVWPDSNVEGVSEQAIDALVRRLRDRLAEIDPDNQYIVTVRGHGFRLDQNS